MMKLTLKDAILTALASATLLGLVACGGSKTDEHADHDQHAGDEHADHDHDHDGEGHAEKEAGPHGGRLLTGIDPHAEFLVLDDGKVKVTFLDTENKPKALEGQSVSVIAGERMSPTTLSFVASGTALVSEQALPEGDDYPVVVSLKTTPAAAAVIERFTMDLSDCPTCEHREYACTCAH